MTAVRDHWKVRMAAALTEAAVSTAELSRKTAIPRRDALSILQQLRQQRKAMRGEVRAGGVTGYVWWRPAETG